MKQEADVVVIGGGIIGCAAAYYLAHRGVKVVLLERREIGAEQSGRNLGFVRQQGRHPAEVPLMIESIKIWRELEQELGTDIEWVEGGGLGVAMDEVHLATLRAWLEIARRFNLDTKVLSGAEINRLIPEMQANWAGGLYTASDGHVDPAKATTAFSQAAIKHGVAIYTGCAAEAVETRDGRVSRVVTTHGEVRTRYVVCAAGAWSWKLAQRLRLNLPQRVVRSTVARTNAVRFITPIAVWSGGQGPAVAFRQRRDGCIIMGGGGTVDIDITLNAFRHLRLFLPNFAKNRPIFRFHVGLPLWRDFIALAPWSYARRHPFAYDPTAEPRPNSGNLTRALADIRRLFPSVQGVVIEELWAGYIDVTPDALPVLGEVATPRGFIFATGFSAHGFAMGPIVGRVVAELIVDGSSSLDIHAFRFSRFAEGDISAPRSAL